MRWRSLAWARGQSACYTSREYAEEQRRHRDYITARRLQRGISLRIMQFQGSQRTPAAVVEGHVGVSGVGWAGASMRWRSLAWAGGRLAVA